MTEGIPDFIGDKGAVTQYDLKAELYGQECAALEEIIRLNKGWPKGWPQRGQILQANGRRPESIVQSLQEGFPNEEHSWIHTDYCEGGHWHTLRSITFPAPCGETTRMLMEWLGLSLYLIEFQGPPYKKPGVHIFTKGLQGQNFHFGQTLTLALCAAVRAKMKVKRD